MTRLRPATPADAAFLVPLYAESSGGVWPAVWAALARDGETTENCATRYLGDPAHDLAVANTVVAEVDGARLGAMTTYRERPADESSAGALPADLAAALAPCCVLSDPDSLFIAELCCLPAARGRGLGTALIEHAVACAAALGLAGVSLRVFSQNLGARRLYERAGFVELARQPVVPHPAINVSGSLLLMKRP